MSAYENIFEAAGKGTLEDVKTFVENGADVNAKKNGLTLAHMLMWRYREDKEHDAGVGNSIVEILEYLISNGMDVNALDDIEGGETPLHAASTANAPVEILQCLIRNGAEIDAWMRKDGSRPLHCAVLGDTSLFMKTGRLTSILPSERALQYLISQGANVNAGNEDRVTALHLLTGAQEHDLMKYLISQGADVNAQTKKGFTPLDMADKYDDTAKRILRSAGGRSGRSSSGGSCLVLLAILGASLTAGICGLALFITVNMF